MSIRQSTETRRQRKTIRDGEREKRKQTKNQTETDGEKKKESVWKTQRREH